MLDNIYSFNGNLKRVIIYLIDLFLSLFPRKRKSLPKNISKILIIKPDHMGDMLFLTSILPLIKKQYPGSVLDVMCASWSFPILVGNPYVNKTYIVDHFLLNTSSECIFKKIFKCVCQSMAALKRIRKVNYDVCFVMREHGRSFNSFAYFCGSKYVIGFASGGLGWCCDFKVIWSPNKHQIQYFLDALAVIGISAEMESLRCELYCHKDDEDYVDRILQQFNLLKGSFVVIHPGSRVKNKMLPLDYWGKLVKKLNVAVVVTGSNNEKMLYQGIQETTEKQLIDLTGLFSVQQLFLVFSKASKIYALESLSAIIAGMTEVPAYVFYLVPERIAGFRPLGPNIHLVTNAENYLKAR